MRMRGEREPFSVSPSFNSRNRSTRERRIFPIASGQSNQHDQSFSKSSILISETEANFGAQAYGRNELSYGPHPGSSTKNVCCLVSDEIHIACPMLVSSCMFSAEKPSAITNLFTQITEKDYFNPYESSPFLLAASANGFSAHGSARLQRSRLRF